MANGHGGYRRPEHPAAVSGPGSLSARTDGGPTQAPMLASGGPYGSRKDMAEIQGGAPLEGGGGQVPPPPRPTGFDAPTERPDEPTTAGAALGPGLGPEAAGIFNDSTESIRQIAPLVASLELVSNLPGATPETRAFVRNLKAQIAHL